MVLYEKSIVEWCISRQRKGVGWMCFVSVWRSVHGQREGTVESRVDSKCRLRKRFPRDYWRIETDILKKKKKAICHLMSSDNHELFEHLNVKKFLGFLLCRKKHWSIILPGWHLIYWNRLESWFLYPIYNHQFGCSLGIIVKFYHSF